MVRPPAASMVGMPTRKENSVAAGRFKPSNNASKIVEPERDEPGKTAAINWPTATAMTMGQVISSLNFFPHSHHPMARKATPPISNAQAMGTGLSSEEHTSELQ